MLTRSFCTSLGFQTLLQRCPFFFCVSPWRLVLCATDARVPRDSCFSMVTRASGDGVDVTSISISRGCGLRLLVGPCTDRMPQMAQGPLRFRCQS